MRRGGLFSIVQQKNSPEQETQSLKVSNRIENDRVKIIINMDLSSEQELINVMNYFYIDSLLEPDILKFNNTPWCSDKTLKYCIKLNIKNDKVSYVLNISNGLVIIKFIKKLGSDYDIIEVSVDKNVSKDLYEFYHEKRLSELLNKIHETVMKALFHEKLKKKILIILEVLTEVIRDAPERVEIIASPDGVIINKTSIPGLIISEVTKPLIKRILVNNSVF